MKDHWKYCDNSVAVFFSKNNKSGNQSKHIDIKFLIVKEDLKKELISIDDIDTKFMIVDPLTKGLLAKVFQNHVIDIGLTS